MVFLILLIIAIQILILIINYLRLGDEKLMANSIRLFTLILLTVLTYVGINFTKWLLVAWFVFNAVLAIDKISDWKDYTLVAFVIIYFAIPTYLLISKDINAFLDRQKELRSK